MLSAICCLTAANGARAFELFGITLFGEDAEERIEVIDPLDYRAHLTISGPAPAGLSDRIEEVSATLGGANQPAPGASGLIARARGDYRGILATLYDEGHYAGTVSIRIGGREAAEMPLFEDLPQNVPVEITVEPGPPFRFGQTRIVNQAPEVGDRVSLDALRLRARFAPGEPARGTVIGETALAEIDRWRQAGHPVADIGDQQLTADHASNRLDATIILDPGPAARITGVTVSGSKAVDPVFLRRMAHIEPGTGYSPDAVARVRDRLRGLGVFNAVRVIEPETVGADGAYPLDIAVTDRKPRRFGFGAAFSSVDGLGLEAFWMHRNLFGRAENLRFDARVSGIRQGEAVPDYDYEFKVGFRKPGVITPDTGFMADFVVLQDDLEHYRERSVTVSAGFTHAFDVGFDAEFRAELARAEITDDDGTEFYNSVSLIAGATLDRRDSTSDPRRGYYLKGTARPFYEFAFDTAAFKAAIDARKYMAFGDELRTVLAGRLSVGTIIGGTTDEIPDNLLFYAGGGGSVRGYPYRGIGVEAGGDTGGGRSLLEVSGELRHQFTDTIGAVAFVDTGYVSPDAVPGSGGALKIGAGLGLRYYTGVGPIRFDIALPLDRGPGDPGVAYYIGIGQAF